MVKALVTVACAAFFVLLPDPSWAGHADTVTGHAPAGTAHHRAVPGYAQVLRAWEHRTSG